MMNPTEFREKVEALPPYVKVLTGVFLLIIGPPGWLIGLALIIFMNWK